MNRRGFTLAEISVAMGLISFVALAGIAVVHSMGKSMGYVTQSSRLADLREHLWRTVRNVPICNCHVNPNLTQDDSNDANLVVNSTVTDGKGVVSFTRIREGCAITDPIVVEKDANLGDGLIVDRIELGKLQPTGNSNEWLGNWMVFVRSASEGAPMAPLQISQFFYLDPASVSANASAVTIERCRGGPPTGGAVTGCPPGMTLVGVAGQFGAFCISRTEHDPTGAVMSLPYFQAVTACVNFSPTGYGPARMCDQNQWLDACKAGIDPSFFTGPLEWVDDASNTGSPLYSGGPTPDCSNLQVSADSFGGSHPFRCCIR